MVFPMTLAIYGLPALSPAAALLWSQRLPGLQEPGRICSVSARWSMWKQESLFWRGGQDSPLLLLGKTFRVSVQQRRESWCGRPWLEKTPPLGFLSLQPPDELGAGVPTYCRPTPHPETTTGSPQLGIRRLSYSPSCASFHCLGLQGLVCCCVFFPRIKRYIETSSTVLAQNKCTLTLWVTETRLHCVSWPSRCPSFLGSAFHSSSLEAPLLVLGVKLTSLEV